jgi:two-component system response regulator FixJ
MNANATVYIVDDDEAVREVIANLVTDMGLDARAYSSGEEFLASYERVGTDCLVLDVRMAGMSGMDLLAKLSDENIPIPVILISGHGYIAMAVEALKKGAIDFVEKPFREQALWEKIKKALSVSDNAYNLKSDIAELTEKLSLLTDKETEVLRCLLAGKTDKQIALDLDVARRTAAFHRANILEKLESTSIVELAKRISKLDTPI